MTATTLRIGFIPLLDCAVLVAAREKGFAARHGLELELVREAAWAAIRDKVAYGVLDAAQMLAGIPIAASLGIGRMDTPMIAPMALGLGGNAITVTTELYTAMCAADPEAMAGPRGHSAQALARVLAAERERGAPRRRLATVFPVSSHAYEIRFWLAAAGIDPDRDIAIEVVPPPRMAEAIRAGHIDGYCVGEPWSAVASAAGLGAIVATKADIWPLAPEKVLGMRTEWAERHPEVVTALVRALAEAAAWADDEANRPELAARLAAPAYVGVAEPLLRQALCGGLALRPGQPPLPLPHRPIFFRSAATFPWRSQALWLLTQMLRWGQIPEDCDLDAITARVYRPDLYRAALAGTRLPVPARDSKVEGAHDATYTVPTMDGAAIAMLPDRLLDGRPFDPSDPHGYVSGFDIRTVASQRA